MQVTAVLLNYKRPQNVGPIIEALRSQTVPIRIALWHNGVTDTIPGADWMFQSNTNLGCLARWHIAAQSGSDYVFSLDDDLLPKSETIVERCIERSRREGDTRIIGRSGLALGPPPLYYTRGSKVGLSMSEDRYADVIKGRFMFLPTSLLNQVPLVFPEYEGRGDDIWISLKTASSHRQHLLPSFLKGAFRQLDDEGEPVGLALARGHRVKRDLVVSRMIAAGELPWYGRKTNADQTRRVFPGSRIRYTMYYRLLRNAARLLRVGDHRE